MGMRAGKSTPVENRRAWLSRRFRHGTEYESHLQRIHRYASVARQTARTVQRSKHQQETSMRFAPQSLSLRTAAAAGLLSASLFAAAQTPPPYGLSINIEQAKKAMVAAEAEARKNNWQVVISIVDTDGHLVMLQRLEAQDAIVHISIGKARTAVNFRRPTKALEDSMAAGGSSLRILAVHDAMPLQGGLPIVVDGKIIGGIGVSGVHTSQDEMVAKAGVDTLAAK
jgi:uncharacterized protein GlcG (DUF336 family)